MPVYEFDGAVPIIGEGTWIAPSAEVIGRVKIGKNCYIGFGAIIRGDFGDIEIGDESAIEEAVVIHEGEKVVIGNRVIVGHMAMLHDVTIRDFSLIGMQSMICSGAVIEPWSIVGEQSMVKKNQRIPTGKIYGGAPAKEIGILSERHKAGLISGQNAYIDMTRRYLTRFKQVS